MTLKAPMFLFCLLTLTTALHAQGQNQVPTREYLHPLFRFKNTSTGDRASSRLVQSQMPSTGSGYPTLRDTNKYSLVGQSWYVPASVTGNHNRSGADHAMHGLHHLKDPNADRFMDSLGTSEGNFTSLYESNSLFDNQNFPGLWNVYRYVDASANHSVFPVFERESSIVKGSFSTEGPMGYAYPRFGAENERLITLKVPYKRAGFSDEGYVEVSSNAVCGGALWELKWKGQGASTPESYVSKWDYGRQIQTSIFYRIGEWEAGSQQVWWALTPGGGYSTGVNAPYPNYDLLYGSPITKFYNDTTGFLQRTECIPLEFNPSEHTTTPASGKRITFQNNNGLVIFPRYRIGKELDLKLLVDFERPIIKHTTIIDVEVYRDMGRIEMPVLLLDYKYSQIYTYDTVQKNLTAHTAFTYGSGQYASSNTHTIAQYGMGMIAATSTASNAPAIGVYAVYWGIGGSASFMEAQGYTLPTDRTGTGVGHYNTTRMTVWRDYLYPTLTPTGLTAGQHKYTAYIITDTRANVVAHMDWLTANQYF